jgi:hypothetical protein
MEAFEGHCWLEWSANSSTLLGSVEITVVMAATRSNWTAQGHLITEDNDDREGFVFLCELDPVFTLRFDDASTVSVTVHDVREGGRRFHLTGYGGPEQRSVNDRMPV